MSDQKQPQKVWEGAKTATYKCKCCGKDFVARTADRDRGWARFCSKSCKATKQEARTGQMKAYLRRTVRTRENRSAFDDTHPFSPDAFVRW